MDGFRINSAYCFGQVVSESLYLSELSCGGDGKDRQAAAAELVNEYAGGGRGNCQPEPENLALGLGITTVERKQVVEIL